ncbi:Os01g0388200, partial [Oryza sativa Japonica Group]
SPHTRAAAGDRWTSPPSPPLPATDILDSPSLPAFAAQVTNLGSLNPKAFVAMGWLVLVVTWAAMGVMVGMAVHQEPRKKIHGQ